MLPQPLPHRHHPLRGATGLPKRAIALGPVVFSIHLCIIKNLIGRCCTKQHCAGARGHLYLFILKNKLCPKSPWVYSPSFAYM
jgi:hypothetical protein